jgi:hypothetical protein
MALCPWPGTFFGLHDAPLAASGVTDHDIDDPSVLLTTAGALGYVDGTPVDYLNFQHGEGVNSPGR